VNLQHSNSPSQNCPEETWTEIFISKCISLSLRRPRVVKTDVTSLKEVEIENLKKMEAKVTGRHALAYACHGKLWVVCEGICRRLLPLLRLQHKTIRLSNSLLEEVMEIEEEHYDGSRRKNFPNPKFCFRTDMSTS